MSGRAHVLRRHWAISLKFGYERVDLLLVFDQCMLFKVHRLKGRYNMGDVGKTASSKMHSDFCIFYPNVESELSLSLSPQSAFKPSPQ